MRSITFENLRRFMGGGRKNKKDKESSFKRSDSFKRISIRKSYLDRGKKKHITKLEVATQTVAEEELCAVQETSSKVEQPTQVNKVKFPISEPKLECDDKKATQVEVTEKSETKKQPDKCVIAYCQWLKGIKNDPPVSKCFKGSERTIIYVPASDETVPSVPVIKQLSSSPVLRKRPTHAKPIEKIQSKPPSPALQRKESNDSAVEMFPWGDSSDVKKSPLIKRRSRQSDKPLIPPDSGTEEMCSLSISFGRIWMDAPQVMAPRSLEMPRPAGISGHPHHSLDSALKDLKDDPMVINRLQKRSTPPVGRTLSNTSNTTVSTGLFSSKDSGFSFSVSGPQFSDFQQPRLPVLASKGFFRKKRPKPKLSVSRDGYFKRTSGALLETKRSSVRRRSSRKKKNKSKKNKNNTPRNDLYQVVISRPPKSLRCLKLDPMIFVPPEKRKATVARKKSFKSGMREIRNFRQEDGLVYSTHVEDSADEGLYESLPREYNEVSEPLSGRISRISLREGDYDVVPDDYEYVMDSVPGSRASGTISPDGPGECGLRDAPSVPRRRLVRRKKSCLSRKRSITYLVKPVIIKAPSTLRRPAKKLGDITQKGYEKKRTRLLSPYVPKQQNSTGGTTNDGGSSGGGCPLGAGRQQQQTRRRTQRRVTHNEKRYHSATSPYHTSSFSYHVSATYPRPTYMTKP